MVVAELRAKVVSTIKELHKISFLSLRDGF
jgi:hypothetical protein